MKLQLQNIFFISDTHFFHKLMLYDNPYGFTTTEELNNFMIEQWNSVVKKDSIIFHLGDFSFGDVSETNKIIEQLNGKIILILGNHDDLKNVIKYQIDSYYHSMTIKVKDESCHKNYQTIVLSHYSHNVWNKHHYNSYHLFGHSHGSLEKHNNIWKEQMMSFEKYIPNELKSEYAMLIHQKDYNQRKAMDVFCMNNDCKPYSYQDIKEILDSKKIIQVDKHF